MGKRLDLSVKEQEIMTNEEKIHYLNELFKKQSDFRYSGPPSLFKYRPFDSFAFDMFEKEYVYLCPAELEDDKTECNVSFDIKDYYDYQYDNLKPKAIEFILQQVEKKTSKEHMTEVRARIGNAITEDGFISLPLLLQRIMDCQELGLLPPEDCVNLVNQLANFPQKMDDPKTKAEVERLFSIGYNAKKIIGICSLCESCENNRMWEKYAGGRTGYCIEYDVSDYLFNVAIFPVIYQDMRDTNIFTQIIGNYIGQLIHSYSQGEIDVDMSQILRLFLTKSHTDWAYQKEWRLLGAAGECVPAPKIKAVYLGKECSEKNRTKLTTIAKEKGFIVK